ncbi:8814_t:CDS:2, partial [Scutellospora calospora]
RLQREIITIRGIPPSLPIPIPIRSGLGSQLDGQLHSNNGMSTPYITPFVPPNVNCPAGSLQQKNEVSKEYDLTGSNITKRKYCRHPKQDKNAPVKPPSAYVMFAHKVRETYQGKGISFADMAKIVGDHWKNIPPKEKEEMEITALKAKEEYQIALSEYKTTKQWKQYQEYLKNFKETNEQSSRKKPKTETLNNETTFSSYSRPNSNFGYPLPFSTTYSSED